jgi:hypothetical protein
MARSLLSQYLHDQTCDHRCDASSETHDACEPFSSTILRSFICRPAKRLQRSDAVMDADALKEKVDDAPPAHQRSSSSNNRHDNCMLVGILSKNNK